MFLPRLSVPRLQPLRRARLGDPVIMDTSAVGLLGLKQRSNDDYGFH